MDAYTDNRASANKFAIEASVIADPFLAFIAAQFNGSWSGSATELLDELNKRADQRIRDQKEWPRKANSLSNALKRITPNLRKLGIDITFVRGPGKRRPRIIRVRTAGQPTVRTVHDRPNPRFQGENPGTTDDSRTHVGRSSTDSPLAKPPIQDDADGANDQFPTQSELPSDREDLVI